MEKSLNLTFIMPGGNVPLERDRPGSLRRTGLDKPGEEFYTARYGTDRHQGSAPRILLRAGACGRVACVLDQGL